MSRCRSCDAPIVWVHTERGRRMPLDAGAHCDPPMLAELRRLLEHPRELEEFSILEPVRQAVERADEGFDPSGWFVLRSTNGGVPLAIAATPDAFPGEPLYKSHFATCPDAAKHRRPR